MVTAIDQDKATDDPISAMSGGRGDGRSEDALCYLRGTRILTSTGEVAIEDLAIGDAVVTRFNGIQPIKWIGRQSYDLRFVARNADKIPLCIGAGALGAKLPARDLWVSPAHCMLLGDWLVLGRDLINGVTIRQDAASALPDGKIEYYQIELAMHDCVIAEGTWSETFADGPDVRGQFHNAEEYRALYPDAAAPEKAECCAARPEPGAERDAALRGVVARAAERVQAGALRGFIDYVSENRIEGWAMDHDHPDLPVLLEIMDDERVIGTVLACDARADLAEAKLGRGHCAFFYHMPEALPCEQWQDVRIRRASDQSYLRMTPACLERIRGSLAWLGYPAHEAA